MAVNSGGLRSKSDCSGKGHKELYGILQTRPVVREGTKKQYRQRGHYKTINPQLSKRNFEEEEKFVTGLR
jgi:hypothetical protein